MWCMTVSNPLGSLKLFFGSSKPTARGNDVCQVAVLGPFGRLFRPLRQ